MGQELSTGDQYGLLDIYADDACRETLRRLEGEDGSVTTRDALAAGVRVESAADSRPSAVRLHHVVLPKLATADLLDYDASTGAVRYTGQGRAEAVASALESGR